MKNDLTINSMMTTDRMCALMNGLSIDINDLEHAEKNNIRFGLHIGSGTYSHVYKASHKSGAVALKVCENTGVVKRLVTQESAVFDILKVIIQIESKKTWLYLC